MTDIRQMVRSHAVAVALGVCAVAGPVTSGQSMQRLPIQQSRAWAEGPIVSETKTDIVVVGAADSATEAQAKSSSFDNAAYRTATEINSRLFAQRSAPLSMSLDALSGYVKRVGRVVDQFQTSIRSGYQGRTRLQLNKTFLDPLTITKLTPPASRPTDAVAVGYLLLPSNLGKAGSVTGRAQVRAPQASNGTFVFTFSIRQGAAGVVIRLDNIDVIEDGSVGSTPWLFDVSVNRRRAFNVPASQYDDRVRSYAMSGSNRLLEFTASVAEPYLEIKVAGTKPQSAK